MCVTSLTMVGDTPVTVSRIMVGDTPAHISFTVLTGVKFVIFF